MIFPSLMMMMMTNKTTDRIKKKLNVREKEKLRSSVPEERLQIFGVNIWNNTKKNTHTFTHAHTQAHTHRRTQSDTNTHTQTHIYRQFILIFEMRAMQNDYVHVVPPEVSHIRRLHRFHFLFYFHFILFFFSFSRLLAKKCTPSQDTKSNIILHLNTRSFSYIDTHTHTDTHIVYKYIIFVVVVVVRNEPEKKRGNIKAII